MKSIIFFLITVISNLAVADNILCVPEAGAGVEHTKDGKIKAGLADISKRKYLLSNESGNWQLKFLGKIIIFLIIAFQSIFVKTQRIIRELFF